MKPHGLGHRRYRINDAATRLLALEGVSVIKGQGRRIGRFDGVVVTSEDSTRACPACGVFATRLKGYRTTRPRHLPCGGRPVSIRWRKARWYCAEPACERGSFTELIGQVPAGMRTTRALRRAAGAAVCDGSRTVVQAGRDLHLSWPIVQQCVEDYAAAVLPETPPATEAIGIDETRRGKPVWKQNPTTGKWELVADAWHIGFVDAVGGQGLFGQVEGRNATSVADWLSAQPASWRAHVRRHRDLPDHRPHQRRLRRQQPPHQARSTQRLRLPQPR
jgi:transposase